MNQIDSDNDESTSMNEENILDNTFARQKSLARPDHEKEFEDELEYGANVRLSERLIKYKYLNSFVTSLWNKYVV